MPENCNDVNIYGVLNFLKAALRRNIEKMIYASISSVYGDSPTLPKREDMHRILFSPYGAVKLACEAYMQFYNHIYGLKATSLIYIYVFGPTQKDPT